MDLLPSEVLVDFVLHLVDGNGYAGYVLVVYLGGERLHHAGYHVTTWERIYTAEWIS